MARHGGEKLLLSEAVAKMARNYAPTKDTNLVDYNGPTFNEVIEASAPGGKGLPALWDEYNMKGCLDGTLSWEDVKTRSRVHVHDIFKNYKLLGDILDRHEATIQGRWLKKSPKSRRKIILEAWGEKMPSSHRPDFEALELEDDLKRYAGTDYRDSYLLPYINEEDLCKPLSLLLLISTRSRCHPSELATSEHEAHRLGAFGHVFGFNISPEFANHYMDLRSQDAENYGQMKDRLTNPEHMDPRLSPPHEDAFNGSLVLEAQDRVLSFLARWVKMILHDFTEDGMLQTPVQPPANLPKPNIGYTSLATIAAEAPYQRPDSLNFTRIASLLAAKHDHIADHIWSLREDPGYFEAQMLEYKEHRRELLVDISGRQHPICSEG